jgi:hypothetical protein
MQLKNKVKRVTAINSWPEIQRLQRLLDPAYNLMVI